MTLGAPNYIAQGISDVGRLASKVKVNADALHCIMDHLATKGIFAEPEPGVFELTPLSQTLLHPAAIVALDLRGIGGRFAHVWSTMLTYVRTGRATYGQIFGHSFWTDLDLHPGIASSYDAYIGPAGRGIPDPRFEVKGGWDSIRSVADVGGGTGVMLANILRLHPQVNGTLIDLPRTIARARVLFERVGLAGRVTMIGQSFFRPLPKGRDIYLLNGVLVDWPDSEAVRIMKRCAEAARPNGRVVILGGAAEPHAPHAMSGVELVSGGKRRSASDLRRLGTRAGLRLASIGRQRSGRLITEFHPTIPNSR